VIVGWHRRPLKYFAPFALCLTERALGRNQSNAVRTRSGGVAETRDNKEG